MDGATNPRELVWVSSWRRGLDFHALSDGGTGTRCGRGTHHGEFVNADLAIDEKAMKPCSRCYGTGTVRF